MPYTVTVTDHAASEVHTAPQPYSNLLEAKDEAAHLLAGIYRDAPEDVTTAVESLIGRINTQRGTVILRDDFLDCTVEVTD
jgi:hypothetical protein